MLLLKESYIRTISFIVYYNLYNIHQQNCISVTYTPVVFALAIFFCVNPWFIISSQDTSMMMQKSMNFYLPFCLWFHCDLHFLTFSICRQNSYDHHLLNDLDSDWTFITKESKKHLKNTSISPSTLLFQFCSLVVSFLKAIVTFIMYCKSCLFVLCK